MKAFLRLTKKAWLLRQNAFACAMAIFVYLCVGFQYHPRTPLGTQCPTAPTQQVKAAIVCCGKVIGYELRTPEPGEAEFMQCQCAEKKAGAHQASLPPQLEPLMTSSVTVMTRAFLLPVEEPPSPDYLASNWSYPPPVPPPDPA